MSDERPTTAGLRLMGYWPGAPAGRAWPHPRDLIRTSWAQGEREATARYLRHGVLVRTMQHPSACLLCGQPQPSEEISDLTYLWPRSFAHYVEVHSVRPPAEFLEHAQAAARLLAELAIDTTWWRGQRGP